MEAVTEAGREVEGRLEDGEGKGLGRLKVVQRPGGREGRGGRLLGG